LDRLPAGADDVGMSAVLPEQLSFRRPTAGDAEEIFALVAARNTAVVGFADYTLDDMVDELAEPGLDLDSDTWLVHDDEQRALLHDRGFRPGTTFHRMRVDHLTPPETPEIPPGVTVRRGAPDDASRRTAHGVLNAAFDGQFGFVPRPYDEWVAAHESRSTFDWSQLTILELDGAPVAFRECTDEFVPDENCNYIGRLAVLPEARGRGLAKFLLRDAFAEDAAAGRAGTILHVDTNNPTPALGLYLAVGMRAVLAIDAWRLSLRTA
jgi:mycothiol synthase